MIEVLCDLARKTSNHGEQLTLVNALPQYINPPILHHDCFFERASSRKTARASSRDSICLELDRTLRASVPKVWAVGTSPAASTKQAQ